MCRTWNRYLLCRSTIFSVATYSQAADKISKQAIAQTEIEGHGAACHQGAPKKRPWTAICRSRDTGPRPRAARLILRATEQRTGKGHHGAPKKRLGNANWGYENAGFPCYIGVRDDEKSV